MTPIGAIGPRCSASAANLIALSIRMRIADNGPHAVLMRDGAVFAIPAVHAEREINRSPRGLVGVYTETAERQTIAGDLREMLREAVAA